MREVVRVPTAPGSKASPDAPAGHHPSGYDPSRACAAREFAARTFKPNSWRARALLAGEWDHHPMVREYLARDSDTHPQGGDSEAAPFMGSAGAQHIAHPQPVGSETATDAAKREGEA